MLSRAALTADYAPGTLQEVTQHDGTVLRLRKLAADHDPTDRVAATRHLAERKAAGEIVTGLLYLQPDAEDLHAHIGTVDTPLNRLDDAALCPGAAALEADRKSTRLNSSHANISYAVFCLKKKKYLT